MKLIFLFRDIGFKFQPHRTIVVLDTFKNVSNFYFYKYYVCVCACDM